jgi:hypothetical protein
MSVSRFISRTAAAALIAAMIPAVAHAQSGKTACNDGSTTSATGANACDGHGGIHRVNSTILHKAPSRTAKSPAAKTPTEPARVSQAGTPDARRDEKPRYEERRGWRWGRHRDERREARREERREEEKHHRVRCRDGKYENVPPGKAKGHEVCKHHGGVR